MGRSGHEKTILAEPFARPAVIGVALSYVHRCPGSDVSTGGQVEAAVGGPRREESAARAARRPRVFGWSARHVDAMAMDTADLTRPHLPAVLALET